ncbi:hypothetical protein A2929_03115 [Candidatus Kaiserbacteria bacterium RIFCSPLOWO2_01_FULL_45_25]|uniref:Uncharacterized protein n=1 Tax=Candidatus Kaiserbacteria bacterium RIFCSPLOWO2_12_FULL_45_26 TaxID=1798525 RepID=A0A1F6FFH4_9BACT|nr:MAG: hypothetical protein A2Z56_00465 [Candidatus Kaiserbacteria bacterium RIFCSPHIGHO2_12_45_16]OGG69529.1 MAG: hypothetical protein A2929_03115 [Candidatus Kaiserbacteria bacterium RIFCSPLOWO2_01_FULL_45_25]OGG84611.1 MAG: hypothetical protein A3G90_00785 [Candidatus Kaiserbacteria bacterium RIFCSPLOWO2_12_FULL_45_26]
METVDTEIFDCYQSTNLVVIPLPRTPTTKWCEVQILPAEKKPMSVEFAKQLLAHYQNIDITAIMDGVGRLDWLASEFASHLHASEVRFHFYLMDTKNGPVVAAAFGSQLDMSDYFGISDDPSD